MQTRIAIYAASLIVAVPLFAVPVFAAGGEAPTVPTCAKGQVYDQAKKKCVKQKAGYTDDNSLYLTGRQLALAGRYGEAISVLSLAANKSDPRILNYLGYSHRKMGRVTVGLGYYQEALKADPNYTLVREYLGEAHLQLGDVASARQQLSEIEKRCGKGCEEYAELSKQIDAFEKTKS
ncbi:MULTISPECIES: tetratricopeptide repeat protein [unclassified Mesorhizobium]|uniref:tetratricopeptide repeat protein n=1 Tax=unclassified Mesorhizobium TaxID=325217 RepID=UPI0008F01126|nr:MULTISPECIES: tetratricopeptide repeat protein [unclassified Mesorhizobium]RJG44323.1 hypothetical protein D3Y55_08675 [Mesorhizobium sp. DCY119]SFT86315.1 Tetratricopeptide repeat-containing protein [Mesorhizobium sp. YR577]